MLPGMTAESRRKISIENTPAGQAAAPRREVSRKVRLHVTDEERVMLPVRGVMVALQSPNINRVDLKKRDHVQEALREMIGALSARNPPKERVTLAAPLGGAQLALADGRLVRSLRPRVAAQCKLPVWHSSE
jgi:hypothetical protein